MKKFKIVSYFKKQLNNDIQRGSLHVKNIDNSDMYESLTYIFKDLTNIYCNIHNYDFIFKEIDDNDLTFIIDNKKKWSFLSTLSENQETFENIVLYKLLLVKNELLKNDSEYVAFFDSDALISNPNISLDEFIDNDHEIWLSLGNHEYDVRQAYNDLLNTVQNIVNDKDKLNRIISSDLKSGYDSLLKDNNIDLNDLFKSMSSLIGKFNEGFFIVKNTKNMKKLFSLICDHLYLSYNSYTYKNIRYTSEGYLLQYFLNSPKFYNKFSYMKPFSQGHILGAFTGKYNEERSFIQHNYSVMKIEDRLKFAQKLKMNKWWKPFLKNDKIKAVLIESTDVCLGDVLTTTAFLKDFSAQYTDIKLYFDFDFSYRYSTNVFIDRLKIIESHCQYLNIWHGEEVDKVVNFRNAEYLVKSKTDDKADMLKCLYEEFEKQTGIYVEKNQNSICIKLNEYEKSNEVFSKFNIPIDKPICLLMFGYHPLYNSIKYPGTSKIQHIIDSLKDDITFVYLGSTQNSIQKKYNNVINLTDKTDLNDLFALAYNSRFVISSITSLTHISSISSKYEHCDIFCFMGCRETPTWFSSYDKLDYVKYHWLGYENNKFGKCLNGLNCCLCDVTFQNDKNKNQKLCQNVKITSDNEAIAACMNEINENEIINYIKGVLNE